MLPDLVWEGKNSKNRESRHSILPSNQKYWSTPQRLIVTEDTIFVTIETFLILGGEDQKMDRWSCYSGIDSLRVLYTQRGDILKTWDRSINTSSSSRKLPPYWLKHLSGNFPSAHMTTEKTTENSRVPKIQEISIADGHTRQPSPRKYWMPRPESQLKYRW